MKPDPTGSSGRPPPHARAVGYWRRFLWALREIVLIGRNGGLKVALRRTRQRVYCVRESLLLETICNESLSPNQTAFAEVSEQNYASRRGLAKAGFIAKSRLRITTLAGITVRCRLMDV